MDTRTVQSLYDHLRFGERGDCIELYPEGRKVTITRVTACMDTMPTCRIAGLGTTYEEWRPSILEPLIEMLLREEPTR